MKRFVKFLKILTLTSALCICAFLCISCGSKAKLESVELIIEDGTPTVYTVGEFDYDGYKLLRTYSDKTTEVVPLSEEHISEVEKLKMWQPGEQIISFEYEGDTFSFTCTFNRNNFNDIELLPLNVVYDGNPHEVQFNKAIPTGTQIKINSGNSLLYTDAGTYTASVTLSKDEYIPKELTAEVNVAKANYDTSTFTFEDEYFEYDNQPHALEIKGKLPQGVSVRYSINGAQRNSEVAIGSYRVTAEFTYTNSKNYEPIEPITRTLHITKRHVNIDEIERNLKSKLDKDLLYYDGESKLSVITSGIVFPKEIDPETVKYTFKRQGETDDVDDVISAGNYQMKITFGLRPAYLNECDLSQDYVSVDFTIQQAFFSTAQFADLETVYTGEPQVLKIADDKIPSSYKHTLVYYIKPFGADDSEYVLGNSAVNAGKYTVKVEFPSDDNFTEVPSKTATLTINKYYYNLTMPESVTKEYDGVVYTLQEVVNAVDASVARLEGLAVTIKGVGVNGDILPENQQYVTPTEIKVNLNITLKMYKVDYIKDENEYNQFIENVKNIFKPGADKQAFESIQKQQVEKTDGVGIYLIVGSCQSDQYETNDRLVIYSVGPRVTDFSKPKDQTRINYDGSDHATFFDLEIPSYVVGEGKNFYKKKIFETEQNGIKKREVTEVISAGYYCCEYELIEDPNFAYTCGTLFTVQEFEIRKLQVSAESLKGFTFTTFVVKKEEDILSEAKKSIAERYPLLTYGKDYLLEVVDETSAAVSFPIDVSKQYYLKFTLIDEVNYIAYDGINPVTVLKQKFDIIDPKPIDDMKLISSEIIKPNSDEAIFYMDDVSDVIASIRDSVLTVVYDYKNLNVKSIDFYKEGGQKITGTDGITTVGKYYFEVLFEDSLYYTINGKNTDMKKTVHFEYRKKIVIDTKTDENLRGNSDDPDYKYVFYSADGYNVSNVLDMTDSALQYYFGKGLNLKESPKTEQIQSDGSLIKRDNTFSLVNGGEFKITYSFQDNYDFIIDGRTTGFTYVIPIKVIKVTELKGENFSFSLDTKGVGVDMYQDVIDKLRSTVSGYTNLNISKNGGKEQITIKKDGQTYTSIKETGKFDVTIKFDSNGIYYRALTTAGADGKYYTLNDLTFNFTVEIKSKSPEIGTVYYKATDEHTNCGLNIRNTQIFNQAVGVVGDESLIENVYIYDKKGNEVTWLYSEDFGYYTYKVTYTNKEFYADSTGTLVFAPCKKVYIEADAHDYDDRTGNFESLYSEFLIECDNPSYGKLTNPRFKGRAYNIYDYFVNIKGYKMSFDDDVATGHYTIDGYAVRITVSEKDLNEYENSYYGFFVFGDKFRKTLLDSNKFFRMEIKGYDLQSHGYVVEYKDNHEQVNL